MISPVDIPPRTVCQPRLHWLISRDWLVGFDIISSQLFRPSRVFSRVNPDSIGLFLVIGW